MQNKRKIKGFFLKANSYICERGRSEKSAFHFDRATQIYETKCSYKLSASSGFTIIETLVAIAILLLAITAPLTIAERGLASAEASRHEITAFYLTQEAIEYIRNIRDMNAIAKLGGGSDWLQGLDLCKGAPASEKGCGVDPTAPFEAQTILCDVSHENCSLYQYRSVRKDLDGLYGHRLTEEGWIKTDMTRKIYVNEIQPGVEATIQVVMTWRAGSLGLRTLTVGENIFNWYDAP